MQLLRQISRESGTAVLVVTHDYRMIEEVDRVIQLVDGRIVDAKIVTPEFFTMFGFAHVSRRRE